MPFFPVDANVIAHWTFNETSGNDAADSVGGATLTAQGPAPIIPGLNGKQRDFSAGYMAGAPTAEQQAWFDDGTNDYTIEVLATKISTFGFAQALLALDDIAGSAMRFHLLIINSGGALTLNYEWFSAAGVKHGWSTSNLNGLLNINVPHRYAVTREKEGANVRIKLFVDGVKLGDGLAGPAQTIGGGTLRWFAGQGENLLWLWGGYEDEICVSKGARAEADIAARATAGGSSSGAAVTPAASIDLILEEFRSTLAAIATSRDAAKLFLEHKTNDPFEGSPAASRDGFSVELEDLDPAFAFGYPGQAQKQAVILVKLGHAPFSTDALRKQHLARDVERLAEILAHRTWSTPGVDAVFFEPKPATDRQNANWWITSLKFRVIYTGAIAS